MAFRSVPLFLTPPARAIGSARRGATGMAGRAVLAWSSNRQCRVVPRVERARPGSDEFLAFLAFWGLDKTRQGGNGGWRSGGKGARGHY